MCWWSPAPASLGKRSKWSRARAEAFVGVGLTLLGPRREDVTLSTPRSMWPGSIYRRGKRLTLDWDHVSFDSYLRLVELAARGDLLDVRVSSSGGGVHVVADYPDNSLDTRRLYGDDAGRAEKDERREPYYRHVLFCEKGGRRR